MNTNQIKFSIIVPVYNVEKYLRKCLDSILNQNFHEFEVICVNDASMDNSLCILKKYAEIYPNMVVINNAINRGLSYSRNKGLEVARGEYVWFIDSDDYILENSLEILETYLSKKKVEVINFNYDVINEGRRKENPWTIENRYKAEEKVLNGHRWLVEHFYNKTFSEMIPIKVFNREFLISNKLCFYEKLLHEDCLFSIQVYLMAKKVIAIDECLYIYRRRDNSITSVKSVQRMDSYVVIINEIISLWKNTVIERDVEIVLWEYINALLREVRNYMFYFPEHKKLGIGGLEDQFLFEIIQSSNKVNDRKYVELSNSEMEEMQSYKKRIIFGAGSVAIELIQILESLKIDIDAIAVTNVDVNGRCLGKYNIYQIDELVDEREDALVIIALVNRSQEGVKTKLLSLGFKNILQIDTERIKQSKGDA